MDQSAAGQPDAPKFETRRFGDVTCIKGDCLDVMPTLPAASFDLVFCDMPYGSTKCAWDVPLDLANIWKYIRHAAKSDSPTILTATQPFASRIVSSNHKSFSHDLIWEKTRPTGFFNAKRAPLKSHEHILVFNSGRYYAPQMVPGKPFCVTTKPGLSDVFGKTLDRTKAIHNGAMRYPRSVLRVDEADLRIDTLNGHKSSRLHPTQKPVALLQWIIASYTQRKEIILDFCAGSGTTGVAALNLGRRAILIEKDPTYFEVMCKRIADHQQKMEAARE